MRVPQKIISRSSIEMSNFRNRDIVKHYIKKAEEYKSDKNREERLKACECIVCYGSSRIGGAAITFSSCSICKADLNSGNTNIDMLCKKCANDNGLCKHCGSDIDLINRRKKRPFEINNE